MDREPQSADDWVALAVAEKGASRYGSALRFLDVALSLHPAHSAATVEKITILKQSGRLAEALQACQHAVSLLPDNTSLKLWLGWLLFEARDYAGAIALAGSAEQQDAAFLQEAVRLLVYAAAQLPDWALASAGLARLERLDKDAAAVLTEETAAGFLSIFKTLYRVSRFEDAVRQFDAIPRSLLTSALPEAAEILSLATLCLIRTGDFGRAMNCLAYSMPTPDTLRPTPALAKPAPGRPTIVTSLMPQRVAAQREAIASWRRLGLTVISVNSADEIAELRSTFDEVTFKEAPRHAGPTMGKPLVYIDDMLDWALRAETDVVGMLNSDIVLAELSDRQMTDLVGSADGSVVFGNRVNVDAGGDGAISRQQGVVYDYGYDWFLFRKKQARSLKSAPFVFGAPWWDLWLPVEALLNGSDIRHVRLPIAFHATHSIGWSQLAYDQLGRELVARLIACAPPPMEARRGQRRLRHLGETLAAAWEERDPTTAELEHLSAVLRATIEAESRG